VFEGGVISVYYDPMIAKLCSRGNDRSVPPTHPCHSLTSPLSETAIALMKAALARYRVQGLGNNMCFLQDIMRNKEYTSRFPPVFPPHRAHPLSVSLCLSPSLPVALSLGSTAL
jgi:acetyl/propionyl-CoA carboxylase alpha subunit